MSERQNIKRLSIRRAAFIAVIILFSTSLFPQSAEWNAAVAGRQNYSEAVYVRTDRDIYIAGERVYMKAWCFNTLTQKPSPLSRVAYVSLLDSLNNPVVQEKLRITGSAASGQIMLPDTLRTGIYYLATCTNWMKNFSPELYSYKKISVINPFRDIDRIRTPERDRKTDTVIFFPESGPLISGVENTAGFLSLDRNKVPVAMHGVITDENDSIICQVQSDDNGHGLFKIHPKLTGGLYLVTTAGKPTGKSFSLPPVSDKGFLIAGVNTRGQNKNGLTIKSNDGFNSSPREEFNLIYAPLSLGPITKKINPGREREIIPDLASLPAGPALVMITDNDGNRFAERWFINDKTGPVIFHVLKDKAAYSGREKVKLDIVATDSEGNPVVCDMTVSIVKSFSLDEPGGSSPDEFQIAGLTSLNSVSGSSDINDRLIFFHPEDNLENNYKAGSPVKYLPEPDGHLITGTVMNTRNGEPIRNETIVLSFVGKTSLCRFSKTDENGCFKFVTTEPGTREVVIQPLSPDIDNYYVELDNPFPDLFSYRPPETFRLDTTRLEEINKAIIDMQVKRIYEPYLADTNKNKEFPQSPDFFGKPDNSVSMSTFIELTSLKEAIKEIIPGVVTVKKGGKTVINSVYRFKNKVFFTNPLIIVDGVPVHNHEKVLGIALDHIEKVDVLNLGYILSNVYINGIIDITTVRGNLSEPLFDNTVFRQEFEAFQQLPGFPSPDYSTPEKRLSRIPDFRNTLYWNPDIKTDEDGKASVEFYTSDIKGTFTLLVEGFTRDGAKGKITSELLVSK